MSVAGTMTMAGDDGDKSNDEFIGRKVKPATQEGKKEGVWHVYHQRQARRQGQG